MPDVRMASFIRFFPRRSTTGPATYLLNLGWASPQTLSGHATFFAFRRLGAPYKCLYRIPCCGWKTGEPEPNLLKNRRIRFFGEFWQFRANAVEPRSIVQGRVRNDVVDQLVHTPALELRGDRTNCQGCRGTRIAFIRAVRKQSSFEIERTRGRAGRNTVG